MKRYGRRRKDFYRRARALNKMKWTYSDLVELPINQDVAFWTTNDEAAVLIRTLRMVEKTAPVLTEAVKSI